MKNSLFEKGSHQNDPCSQIVLYIATIRVGPVLSMSIYGSPKYAYNILYCILNPINRFIHYNITQLILKGMIKLFFNIAFKI